MRFIIYLRSFFLGQLIGCSQQIDCEKKSGNAHPADRGKYDIQTTGFQAIAGAVPLKSLKKTSSIYGAKPQLVWQFRSIESVAPTMRASEAA
jgi:hypothetical protein